MRNVQNGIYFNPKSSQINYSNDDTLLILGHDSLLPQDITWDDINNLDLDFEIATNGLADCTDDNFYERNLTDVSCATM